MILQCPDCQTKMKPKPPAGTRAGATVQVSCRCGSKLRFVMPRNTVQETIRNAANRAIASNDWQHMADALNSLRR